MEQMSDMVYDNFPIKVYAFDSQDDVFVRLAGDAKGLSVCVGEQGTVAQLELYGSNSKGKTLEARADKSATPTQNGVRNGTAAGTRTASLPNTKDPIAPGAVVLTLVAGTCLLLTGISRKTE